MNIIVDGKNVEAREGEAQPDSMLRDTRIALFAQDSYQVGSKLLLDYGLRYDLSTFVLPKDAFVQSTIPNGGAGRDYNNLAPRFGFAWTPFENGKTVVRGGFGLFYGTASLYRMDDYSQVYPFAVTETFSRITTDPTRLTLSNPFPADRRGFSGVTSSYGQFSTEPKSQYMESWNLTVEKDVYQGVVVELAYTGSKGVHLIDR